MRPAKTTGYIKIKCIHIKESPVVMKIITLEPVRYRCLGTNRFQGRMPGSRCHAGIKTGIGNSHYAHFAVIAGNIFHEPVNCIVSIGRFVNIPMVFYLL